MVVWLNYQLLWFAFVHCRGGKNQNREREISKKQQARLEQNRGGLDFWEFSLSFSTHIG
jgi:hypothetical protein